MWSCPSGGRLGARGGNPVWRRDSLPHMCNRRATKRFKFGCNVLTSVASSRALSRRCGPLRRSSTSRASPEWPPSARRRAACEPGSAFLADRAVASAAGASRLDRLQARLHDSKSIVTRRGHPAGAREGRGARECPRAWPCRSGASPCRRGSPCRTARR